MKRCRKCGHEKPLTAFAPEPKVKAGLRATCRDCRSSVPAEERERRRTARAETAALLTQGLRRCRGCSEVKPLEQFYVGSRRRKSDNGPIYGRCTTCSRVYSDRWRNDPENRQKIRVAQKRARTADPEKVRARNVRTGYQRYGLTLEEVADLAIAQEGRCALCRQVPTGTGRRAELHVDHDHGTGVIRGLLCARCNAGLGFLGDDLDGLLAAVAYLLRAQVDPPHPGRSVPSGLKPGRPRRAAATS